MDNRSSYPGAGFKSPLPDAGKPKNPGSGSGYTSSDKQNATSKHKPLGSKKGA